MKKESKLISIVVPVYNVEVYLNKCVTSLIQQTYRNLEIVLVDDGATDNCPQMCDDWAQRDSRIKVIHKPNGGLSDARNVGMMEATGELVAFVDSDDWIDEDTLEKMYLRMQTDDSDIVSCGVKWVTEDGTLLNDITVKHDEDLDTYDAMSELISDGKLKQHVWNKLYKRAIIENIPFEKGKFHEDVFWSYQVIGRAKKVSLMTESFYNYVQRSNSIMGESYSEKRLDALDAMKQRCEYIKGQFPDLHDKALYVYISSCMYHLQCALHTNQNKSVIENITDRLDDRKTGHPTKGQNANNKIWFTMFVHCPVFTAKIRNLIKVGI